MMIKNFDEIQKLSKDNVDAAMKSFGAASKGAQAIAVEVADYSKKAFEEGTAAFEKLLGAKSVEKVIELQQAYLKDAYEGFVAQATKIGELYADSPRKPTSRTRAICEGDAGEVIGHFQQSK